MREQFTQELATLHADVVDIVRDVTTATRSAVTSLVAGDIDLANEVVAGDDEINVRCTGDRKSVV